MSLFISFRSNRPKELKFEIFVQSILYARKKKIIIQKRFQHSYGEVSLFSHRMPTVSRYVMLNSTSKTSEITPGCETSHDGFVRC